MPFANDYRGPDAGAALEALERALVTQVAAETVAAIVVEPVQGEGGFVVAPQEFMEGIRRICDDNGIVMVVDEVQTGFGRTGQLLRDRALRRRAGPDHVAKSIAAGLPLSGVLGRAEIMDAPAPNAVGGTYVGNPGRPGGRARRARRLRRGGPRRARRRDRRDDPSPHAGVAGTPRGDRRRPRARRDAGDRARPRPRVEESRAGARRRRLRRGVPQRPAAPQRRDLLQRRSRARPADDRGRGAGRRHSGSGSRRSSTSSARPAVVGIGA